MITDLHTLLEAATRRARRHTALRLAVAGGTALLLSAWPAGAYESVSLDDPGTISGWVQVETEPASELLESTQDPDFCGSEIEIQLIEVNQQGRLRNAVVFISEIARGRRIDKTVRHQLRLEKCRATPDILAVTAGQVLEISNHDPVLHTIRATRNQQEDQVAFTASLPVKGMKIDKRLPDGGLLELRCTAGHAPARTWVYVFEHPYHALTDKKGRFTIEGIPAGDYQLTVWHPEVGTQTLEISVQAGTRTEAEFDQLAIPAEAED